MTATLATTTSPSAGTPVGTAPRRVIELRGVGRRYPGEPPVDALLEVDLAIDHGELLAIVGPSGSGKTTLLHVLGTLDRATSGEVIVAGERVDRLSDRSLSALRAWRIGFVFQHFHLLGGETALDNVADGLLYRGVSARERREAAEQALERVGLAHRGRHRPGQLSGGERQRVAVARALAREPQILFADEPTAALDHATGHQVIAQLAAQRYRGVLVVVTHDPEMLAAADQVWSLRDGRMTEESTTEKGPVRGGPAP